jgi:uncharacterized membrane protein required for colicin V production
VQILSQINWVDVFVVILMFRMSYVAFMDGLSHEIFPLIGSIAVLVLSLHYYKTLGDTISAGMGGIPPEITNLLGFVIIVVISGFAVKFLKIVIDKIVKVQWHPVIEKFGGLFAGMVKAYVITAVILTMMALIPLSYIRWSVQDRSLTGKYFLMAGPQAYSKFKALISDGSAVPKKAPAKKEPS